MHGGNIEPTRHVFDLVTSNVFKYRYIYIHIHILLHPGDRNLSRVEHLNLHSTGGHAEQDGLITWSLKLKNGHEICGKKTFEECFEMSSLVLQSPSYTYNLFFKCSNLANFFQLG